MKIKFNKKKQKLYKNRTEGFTNITSSDKHNLIRRSNDLNEVVKKDTSKEVSMLT